MRTRQKEIDRVDIELERRSQEIRELQSRLQDAEKILVRNSNTGEDVTICPTLELHCMKVINIRVEQF